MKPKQILVVDDENRIVDSISLCLQQEGFQTIGAFNGEEALKLFKNEKFDLVLLDVSMPGMNGYEVMEHIYGSNGDIHRWTRYAREIERGGRGVYPLFLYCFTGTSMGLESVV